jgi:GNAT superfamily N-acetyltransferase
VGGDLATVQPSSLRELAGLEYFYEPPSGCLLWWPRPRGPAGVGGVHRLDPGVDELKRLYVAPEARGLGRHPVVAAVEAAADLGFDVLRLETHAGHMPAAVAQYRKLGFRVTEPYHPVVDVDGVLTIEPQLHRLSA